MPTQTVGPTTEAGFPSSIVGLTIHSVAQMRQLAGDGRLDGRLAAVGGYWAQFALPCPYMPHQPVLLGFCYGGRFADTPEAAQACCGSDTTPVATPETASGDLLWSAGGVNGRAAMVVLIVHAADSRTAQCAPGDRAGCHSRLVIDSVAWVNGVAMGLNPDTTARPGVGLTPDDVIAAGVRPGEQLVTAYGLRATELNEVDPRLIGQGSGVVWYQRLTSGTPDADGISAGVVRLVANPEGGNMIVAELPLAVADDYAPARVVLDTSGQVPGPDGRAAHFAVTITERVIAQGWLDSSSTPLALVPGDYTVRAWASTGAITSPPSVPECDLPLSLAAGDDVAYYADWPGGSDCTWKAGSLFP